MRNAPLLPGYASEALGLNGTYHDWEDLTAAELAILASHSSITPAQRLEALATANAQQGEAWANCDTRSHDAYALTATYIGQLLDHQEAMREVALRSV